ncbi:MULTISPECIES: FUSC family protein [Streptomyces]|uniref:FUSC family protein n=1 Tax=Streptomyces albus TaxID=1888 RepID=A0A8H1QPJ4_9ACTN|nr:MULTISPECIES: FUSC family protein [Streptomyces]TGG81579.1 FUSC family protein [Streptomyces albus]
MAWTASLAHTVRKGFRTERAFADPWAIARAVLAVAVGAAIGWMRDDLLATTMMSVGAFICGIGTLLAPLRHRAVNALAMAAAFTAATTLGVFLQPTGWYVLPVLAVVAFLAGLWRALGPAPGIRACLVVIGMLITADVSPGIGPGLEMVRWIGAGAALVVLVQLLPPYGNRHAAQRRKLAEVYASLAAYARTEEAAGAAAARPGAAVTRSGGAARMSPAPFTAARNALGLLPSSARPAAAPLYGLLGEAERIRRALYAAPGTPHVPYRALAEDPLRDEEIPALCTPEGLVRGGLRRLRAGLDPSMTGTPLLRHALRVGIGTTLGEAAGRAIGDFWGHGLPSHGFWAALTTMLVLFPDYEHTFARGWSRPVGSAVGGLLAWGLLQFSWSHGALALATVAFSAVTFVLLRTGQHVLNVVLTAWIVFLLHQMGTAQGLVAWGRPADTVLGAAIALAVFLVLPTWHHHRVGDLLARWLRTQQRLLPALLTGYADVGAADRAALEDMRDATRRAREELESAVAHLPHEPRGHRARWTADELARLTAAAFELTRCTALLTEHLPRRPAETVPELAEYAAPLRDHLGRLAQLARSPHGGPALRPGALRDDFAALCARTGLAWLADPAEPDAVSRPRARALNASLRTVLALETLTAQLAPRPGEAAAGGPADGPHRPHRTRHGRHARTVRHTAHATA